MCSDRNCNRVIVLYILLQVFYYYSFGLLFCLPERNYYAIHKVCTLLGELQGHNGQAFFVDCIFMSLISDDG